MFMDLVVQFYQIKLFFLKTEQNKKYLDLELVGDL